ncbi:MAG: undecaprenyldiphospho-muramoylpentapeptide beta-N-acetylglucosaminyltransferase [Elusimicrobia bacterium RIFOXYA2_FULL_39_19]|nr:MAG: undecaprenyldiphospho-muramoylpentapeptide beta-N-acetylglucosaminyltransferase [Elusimicrobia bacterium RIFOXYA2_FULL_39_19]
MNKKILLAAGGTGGHIYPAVCIAKELIKQGCSVAFVVNNSDKSIDFIKSQNLKYYELKVIGMPRKPSFKIVVFICKLVLSFFAAAKILISYRPGVVVGFGNYLSFPVIFVSKLFFIPAVLHEQNVISGLANKVLSVIADKVLVSFPDTVNSFGKNKAVFTGNIIRPELLSAKETEAFEKFSINKGLFTVLIFGGSQGARYINSLLCESLKYIADLKDKVQFIHLTGERDYILVQAAYKKNAMKAYVYTYREDIWNAYATADLVVCRAGATTVAELIAIKKPAVLIPLSSATANHQKYNAGYLSARDAGIMLEEKNLNPDVFAKVLRELIEKPEKLQTLKNNLSKIRDFETIIPEKRITETILSLTK